MLHLLLILSITSLTGPTAATDDPTYLPLVCPRHAVEIYQLPKSACPPLYESEIDVKGSMIWLDTNGQQLDGFRVCAWTTACLVEDQAGFFSSAKPGELQVRHTPRALSEYQAKQFLQAYQHMPDSWTLSDKKVWDKQPCGTLQQGAVLTVGAISEDTVSIESTTPVIRPNMTVEVDGVITPTCDVLEGECQLEDHCWVIWAVPPAAKDWKTPIRLIEGLLYQSNAENAVLHVKNEALSFHVTSKWVNGQQVWVADDHQVGFILAASKKKTKRHLGHRGSHLQFAIDLANHATHQLDWLCNNKAGTKLWQSALVGPSSTLVARTFLGQTDIFAESCGPNCIAVYHCLRVTSYRVNNTVLCYTQPPITYRLPGTASEFTGYLDITSNVIVNAASDIPCESCPVLYYQASRDHVNVIYPHGGVESKVIKPFPAAAALNPTPLKVTQVEGLFAARPVTTLASGVSQLRNILRRWTGSESLTPNQIQQIMDNRAVKTALHITPNSGWVGYIFTALEWTAELGGLIVGSRFLTLAVQGVIGYMRNRHNTD